MRIIVTPALQLKKLRLSSSLVSAQSAHRAECPQSRAVRDLVNQSEGLCLLWVKWNW